MTRFKITTARTPEPILLELKKPFYSPAEVAEFASVSSSTILNYIHEGKLASVKLSERTYRIPRKAVIRLMGMDAPETIIDDDPSAIVEF